MPSPTSRQRRARARHLRLLVRTARHSWALAEPAGDRWWARRRIVSAARRRSDRRTAAWPDIRRVKAEYHRRNR